MIFAKQFKHTGAREAALTTDGSPWLPDDLAASLSRITTFLREAFGSRLMWIGLYGSWQRGDAGPESDVDLVVVLNHEVSWFDATDGIVNRSEARRDRVRWHTIEREANERCVDSRAYSIAVVTPGMLDYYASQGPIHLQNWVHAIENCHPLWEDQG
jgi:predicted nucleotidyltransferase